MGGKNRIYWDSCIFIAHLTNEVRKDPNVQLGIVEVANLYDIGQVDLVTSTITITEVLESTMPPEKYESFRKFYSSRNFLLYDVTREIAELAGEIRNYHRPNVSTINTPDCIHIATAIVTNCNLFLTTDGESNNRLGILDLNNPIAGKYNLKIDKPKPSDPNMQLDLFI